MLKLGFIGDIRREAILNIARFFLVVFSFAILSIVAACGGGDAGDKVTEVLPTPTEISISVKNYQQGQVSAIQTQAVAKPTATKVPPTATPIPPTATPVPPSPTPTLTSQAVIDISKMKMAGLDSYKYSSDISIFFDGLGVTIKGSDESEWQTPNKTKTLTTLFNETAQRITIGEACYINEAHPEQYWAKQNDCDEEIHENFKRENTGLLDLAIGSELISDQIHPDYGKKTFYIDSGELEDLSRLKTTGFYEGFEESEIGTLEGFKIEYWIDSESFRLIQLDVVVNIDSADGKITLTQKTHFYAFNEKSADILSPTLHKPAPPAPAAAAATKPPAPVAPPTPTASLIEAILETDIHKSDRLLREHIDFNTNPNINPITEGQYTGLYPLHLAIAMGDTVYKDCCLSIILQNILALMEMGADLNIQTAKNKGTPLHMAILINRPDIVEALTDYSGPFFRPGASREGWLNINLMDAHGLTPLDLAILRHSQEKKKNNLESLPSFGKIIELLERRGGVRAKDLN